MSQSQPTSSPVAAYTQHRDDYRRAINFSKSIRNRDHRLTYLVDKARTFLANEDYDHAALVAWHVLYQLSATSLQARQILHTAYSRIFASHPRD